MAKTPDNASILFKKGKNIDGLTIGWSNKPFPQWWGLNPLGRAGRFGLWGFELRANFALNAPTIEANVQTHNSDTDLFRPLSKGVSTDNNSRWGFESGTNYIKVFLWWDSNPQPGGLLNRPVRSLAFLPAP